MYCRTTGPNFLRDMNRGSSDIVVRGNVRGYSTGEPALDEEFRKSERCEHNPTPHLTIHMTNPVLRTKFRLSSDLECVVTYNWNDGTTRHSCKTDKRIRLAYTS